MNSLASVPRRVLSALRNCACLIMMVWGGIGYTTGGMGLALGYGPAPPGSERTTQIYDRLPVSFEANYGQAEPDVRFMARGSRHNMFLTSKAGIKLGWRVPDGRGPDKTRYRFISLSPVGVGAGRKGEGIEELPGKSHYFIGSDPARWRTNIPHYARVRYREVYPGVDLICYGNQRRLEFDFVVAPGGDPRVIQLRFEGQQRLRIDGQGNLILQLEGMEIQQLKPVVYQEINGRRVEVAGRYLLKGLNEVAFRLGPHDPRHPLVIDPVLVYSTHLGGTFRDNAWGVAADPSGNVYVTGSTESRDFLSSAPGRTAMGQPPGAYVTKINPAGTAILYTAYLGGTYSFAGTTYFVGAGGAAIAVDSAGNAYVTGGIGSSPGSNFPITAEAFQRDPGTTFVAKLDASGSKLLYSSYFGGNVTEAFAIAVDSQGNAYIAGKTWPGIPTVGPVQASHGGGVFDAFVAKVNPTGTRLVYSTYLGGSANEAAWGIAVDASGSAYVAGETESADFPTANAFQRAHGGGGDAFVSKLNPSGSALVYSTFLGGQGGDGANGIAVDSLGGAYAAGWTSSKDFPTVRAFQPVLKGDWIAVDAFVAKFDASGSALAYSTYLGGTVGNNTLKPFEDFEQHSQDSALGIAVDSSGRAYVVGWTSSRDFPLASPLQAVHGGGGNDAFVVQIASDGRALEFSTYLGGNGAEDYFWDPPLYYAGHRGMAIALDGSGNIYVAGGTTSPDFPTTPGVVQRRFGGFPFEDLGSGDAFVAKINPFQISSSAGLTSRETYTISTVAGGESSYGGDGTPATLTALGSIQALAVDSEDNLLIAERYCQGQSIVTPPGIIIPIGESCSNGRIRKVARDGIIATIAGQLDGPRFSGDGGPATAATFNYPNGMTVDKLGNLFIADYLNHRIRKIAPDGVVSTVAGSSQASNGLLIQEAGGFGGDRGPAVSALLNQPHDVAVDSSGNLFIADWGNHRVRKVSPNGIITTVAGNGSAAPSTGSIGDGGPAVSAQLSAPTAVTVDSEGNLFVIEGERVRKITPAGVISTVAGTGKAGFNGDDRPAVTAALSDPHDLVLDQEGNLFIADPMNNRVRKMDRKGVLTTVAGSGTTSVGGFAGDRGPGTLARLSSPNALAMDSEGNLYISDWDNRRVRKLTAPRPAPSTAREGVVHAATYKPDNGIARGSLFSIFGTSLGPKRAAQAFRFPLPLRLGDVSIKVAQGQVTVDAPLLYASATQINAVMPSNAPLGDAAITVTYSGITGAAAPVKIVQTNLGLFFTPRDGHSFGVIQNFVSSTEYPLNSPSNPAKPGQIVVAWGTGLGPISAPDNLPPEGGNLPVAVEVSVGEKSARTLYQGRAPGFAGLDSVYFEIPSDAPLGCYVPVQVKAANSTSNAVAMAITATGDPCSP